MLKKLKTNTTTISIFILILSWCKLSNGYIDEDGIERDGIGKPIYEFQTGQSEATEHANEAPCMFDNVEGGSICNCGYRSEVKPHRNIFFLFNLLCDFINSDTKTTDNGWKHLSSENSQL